MGALFLPADLSGYKPGPHHTGCRICAFWQHEWELRDFNSGLVILFAVLLITFYKLFVEQDTRINHKIPLLTVSVGILFCAGCMLRYVILLNGPAGISITIGISVIIVVGWNQYRHFRKEDSMPDDATGILHYGKFFYTKIFLLDPM